MLAAMRLVNCRTVCPQQPLTAPNIHIRASILLQSNRATSPPLNGVVAGTATGYVKWRTQPWRHDELSTEYVHAVLRRLLPPCLTNSYDVIMRHAATPVGIPASRLPPSRGSCPRLSRSH